MNSLEIFNALKNNQKLKKFFTGVYPSDHLPKNIKTPALIIVNTDPSHKSGTHWLAIYISKTGDTEIFNSFGALQPIQSEFRRFLQENSRNGCTIFNNKRIQSDYSLTCGNYCCLYLYYKATGRDMNNFLKLFSDKKLLENDEKIMNMYYKYFSTSRKNLVKTDQIGGLICNQVCKSRKCLNK